MKMWHWALLGAAVLAIAIHGTLHESEVVPMGWVRRPVRDGDLYVRMSDGAWYLRGLQDMGSEDNPFPASTPMPT